MGVIFLKMTQSLESTVKIPQRTSRQTRHPHQHSMSTITLERMCHILAGLIN